MAMRERIGSIARSVALPLTRIGVITAAPGLVVRDERGDVMPTLPDAWDHFG